MKKQIAAILITALVLTGCGGKETEKTGSNGVPSITEAAADAGTDPAEAAPDLQGSPDTEAAENAKEEADGGNSASLTEEEPADEEAPGEAQEEPEDRDTQSDIMGQVLENDYFSAELTEFDLPEGEDEMVTVVFEFTNITDKSYYKNDEEIPAGGSWEKRITYPLSKWEKDAAKELDSWIHYDLYEDDKMQEQIFKGGLKFSVAQDLSLGGMELFEEEF
ncbi:MAG: hypothetical protein K5697_07255 [Lachnospiraceae bacterium]|nr:hypothetical protein [Lachnospiraceae bacterium]